MSSYRGIAVSWATSASRGRAPKVRQRLPQLLELHAELTLDSLLRSTDSLARPRDEPLAGGRYFEEV